MTTQPQPQCAKVVPDGWRGRRCSRRGVVERDGRWYCRQHDPVARAERREAKAAARETRTMAALDRMRLAQAAPDLLAAAKAYIAHRDTHYEGYYPTAVCMGCQNQDANFRAAIAKAEAQ